ncbi:MAG: hypothetical protein U9R36_00385 [Elusimicrobiota bacterium]|nr:hypothetical protein [Elusimicrobiota bacterium]
MNNKTLLSGILIFAAALSLSVRLNADQAVLEFNPNVRVKALGAAGAAIRGISTPLAVSPAGIGVKNHPKLSFFYGTLSTSTHFGYVEYDYPFTTCAAVGAASRVTYENEKNYSRDFFLGASFDIFRGLNIGTSGGLISDTVSGNTGEAFTVAGAMFIAPFSWLNFSAEARNLNSPVIEYETINSSTALTMDLRGGISIYNSDFFNIVADCYIVDIEEKQGEMEIISGYGLEIYPLSSLAVRGGFVQDNWRAGVGIISKDMDIDYAYVDRSEGFKHYIQYTRKFGAAPSIKEKELNQKEARLKKDELYLGAKAEFNKEEIARAKKTVEKYISKYGQDSRIENIQADIKQWLDRKREESMGRAEELKKEVLKNYHQGRINEARRKIENMKLLAPNYDQTLYLEHLIKARVLLESGFYEEAEDELVEALKINPDSEEVLRLYRRIREVIRLSE